MPIIARCEHCNDEAAYAVDSNDEGTGFELRPCVVITEGQRHICHNLSCLEKEITRRNRDFWFKPIDVAVPACTRPHKDEVEEVKIPDTDIPF